MSASILQRQQVLYLGPVFLSFLKRHARWTLWPQGIVLLRSLSWICLLHRPQRSYIGVRDLFLIKLGLIAWFYYIKGFPNVTLGCRPSRWFIVLFFPIYEEIVAVSGSFLLTFVNSWRGFLYLMSISSRTKVKRLLFYTSLKDFAEPSFWTLSFLGKFESSFSLSCS